jgi:hypothetical protein
LVKATKYKINTLAADKNSDGEMTDLKFINLTIGNSYKITFHVMADIIDNDSLFNPYVTDGASTLFNLGFGDNGASAVSLDGLTCSESLIWVATTTEVEFHLFSDGDAAGTASKVRGNGTTQETFSMLEDITTSHTPTTDWD